MKLTTKVISIKQNAMITLTDSQQGFKTGNLE